MFTSPKIALGCLIFLSSTAQAGWFSESVDLNKFPQSVIENGEFKASPVTMLKEVTYSDKVLSINVLNATVNQEKLSYIKSGNAAEKTADEDKSSALKSTKRASKKPNEEHAAPLVLEPYGTRTSTLGGLFTLGAVNTEVASPTFKISPESKAVNEIKNIDGTLFPLKEGNALFFSYSMLGESDKYGVTFEVKSKSSAQDFLKDHAEAKDLNLIGDVYVIGREIKSTNERAAAGSCELYYADEISYVIGSTCADKAQWLKAYKLNKDGEAYRTEVAALNKQKEQEEIDAKKLISSKLTPEMKKKATEKLSQGFNLWKEGEFEAAVIRFNQALEIDPANGLGHYYLAETYARLNDVLNAMEHYRYTVLFSPDIKEAAIAEVKLSKMKDSLSKSQN